MSTVIDTLIYDRTQADVNRVFTLKNKILTEGLNALSAEEKAEYMAGMKGAYNAPDLNRVESAVAYIAEQLVAMPNELNEYAASLLVAWTDMFSPPYNAIDYADIDTKTDWSISDTPRSDSMTRYLSNVVLLQTAFDADYPSLPNSMDSLTFDGANAIERTLVIIDAKINNVRAYKKMLINNTASAWFYSGDVYAGEV